ncbi:hypothetical protein KF913_12250 [Candidatus Obscuribacterales bacterium]|nr:hypothetical protein [Candidatus Obscuribacterales bacterium]
MTLEYGRGFSRSNLADMVRFSETFPDETFSRHCLENWVGFISGS